MNVGILTFHFVPNQGAVLQCYAMQKFLESAGHSVRVVDYRPSYHAVRYAPFKNPFRYARWFYRKHARKSLPARLVVFARAFVRALAMNAEGTDRRVAAAFRSFSRRHLHLTDPYPSLAALRRNPPLLDACLVGSDQLWNPELLDQDFDSAYFLDFGPDSLVRFSYAVSLGKPPTGLQLCQLGPLCKRLDAISLRESSPDVERALPLPVHVCLDPTLLLDEGDYADVESPERTGDGDYIFVYGFETTPEIETALAEVRRRHPSCRVVNGSPHRVKLRCPHESRRVYGPDMFLSFVKHAQCIVTNSFHATAFSVIYQKEFVTVPHSSRALRMTHLLGSLGLASRLWGHEAFSFDAPVDWSAVRDRILELRQSSVAYLKAILDGGKQNTDADGTSAREGRAPSLPRVGSVPGMSLSGSKDTARTEPGPPQDPRIRTDDGLVLRAFAGYLKDKASLKSVASGGAATALAEQAIREGGVVFGVAFAPDFRSAEYTMAESPEDLEKLKDSKYAVPNRKIGDKWVYELACEKLEEGRKVLFFGLPCDIGILMKWVDKRKSPRGNLLTVDLICHGAPSGEFLERFVDGLEQDFHSKVTELSFRHVESDWNDSCVRVRFENGARHVRPLYETDFGFAFKFDAMDACYHCRFKGLGHVADITIGDCWGMSPKDRRYNPHGVSLLLPRTAQGASAVEKLDPARFELFETDLLAALRHNPAYAESAKDRTFRKKFEADCAAKGLHRAVLDSPGYKLFRRAIRKRRLSRWLPGMKGF